LPSLKDGPRTIAGLPISTTGLRNRYCGPGMRLCAGRAPGRPIDDGQARRSRRKSWLGGGGGAPGVPPTEQGGDRPTMKAAFTRDPRAASHRQRSQRKPLRHERQGQGFKPRAALFSPRIASWRGNRPFPPPPSRHGQPAIGQICRRKVILPGLEPDSSSFSAASAPHTRHSCAFLQLCGWRPSYADSGRPDALRHWPFRRPTQAPREVAGGL